MNDVERGVQTESAEAVGGDSSAPQVTTPTPQLPVASPSATACPPDSALRPEPRLLTAARSQIIPAMTIDQLIESDHPARAVWRFVEQIDLSLLNDRIKSRVGLPGRSAIDRRILVSLWLYAIFSGFSSARQIAELCVHYNPFRWIAGGVCVGPHTLSDFLVDNLDFLEVLFEHSVERLRQEGLVDLDRIAQDGMRVRASAGAASFRRGSTLEKLLQDAKKEVERLLQQVDQTAAVAADGAPEVVAQTDVASEKTEPTLEAEASSTQQTAAKERGAKGRVERIEKALKRLPQMEAKKQAQKKTTNGRTKAQPARVSTTDPEATVMKMADGGFRPGYNMEFCTTTVNKIIVGVEVVTIGSDQGLLLPMLNEVEDRFAERPLEALVDGGVASHDDISKVQKGDDNRAGCKVYSPVQKPKDETVDRHASHATDSKEVAEWRKRMGTDEAKNIYKQRAATAELVNAHARNRGLVLLLVRGLQKVKAIACWFAIVHNMARGFALLPQF
jgi:transposase